MKHLSNIKKLLYVFKFYWMSVNLLSTSESSSLEIDEDIVKAVYLNWLGIL